MVSTNRTAAIPPVAAVVVTRPEPQCQQWVARLREAGFVAVGLPLLRIAPAADPLGVRAEISRWLGAIKPGYRAIMLVSSAAINGLWDALGHEGVQRLLASTGNGLRFWVTGPGSAQTLIARGVEPCSIDLPDATGPKVQFDSPALWAVVSQAVNADSQVMLVRGDGDGRSEGAGNAWLEVQLRERACNVSVIHSYQRLAPVWNAKQKHQLQQLREQRTVWLLTSVEAMSHLPDFRWEAHTAVVTHPRQRDAALNLGFGRVLLSDPRLEQVIVSLKSLQ